MGSDSAAGDGPRQLWDQQPEEGNSAYTAFQAFCGLGPGRSLDRAYQITQQDKGDGSARKGARAPGTWRTWSKRWEWKPRSDAWDRHAAGVKNKARDAVLAEAGTDEARAWLEGQNARRLEIERDEWRLRGMLIKKVEAMLAFPLAEIRSQQSPDGNSFDIYMPADWKLADAAKLLTVATQLGRMSASMPATVSKLEKPLEEQADKDQQDAMFESRGELAERIPPDVFPAMPADPDAKPALGQSVLANDGLGLIQPAEPPRPDKPIGKARG